MREKSSASHSWLGIMLVLASATSSFLSLLCTCSSQAKSEVPLGTSKGMLCRHTDLALAWKSTQNPPSSNRYDLIWSKKVHWRNVDTNFSMCWIKSLVLFTLLFTFPALTATHRKPPCSLVQRPKTVPNLEYEGGGVKSPQMSPVMIKSVNVLLIVSPHILTT